MKKVFTICFLCLSTHFLFGQMMLTSAPIHYHSLKIKLQQVPAHTNFFQQIQHFTFQESRKSSFSLVQSKQQPMPAAYAYKDLAFFCKIEVQLEKAVKLPVKFRLGSVDYVDYLEGKRDSY